MSNHLKGRHCLFELDARGNLVIHSDGKHMLVPAGDVADLLRWLNRKREAENASPRGERQVQA